MSHISISIGQLYICFDAPTVSVSTFCFIRSAFLTPQECQAWIAQVANTKLPCYHSESGDNALPYDLPSYLRQPGICTWDAPGVNGGPPVSSVGFGWMVAFILYTVFAILWAACNLGMICMISLGYYDHVSELSPKGRFYAVWECKDCCAAHSPDEPIAKEDCLNGVRCLLKCCCGIGGGMKYSV